MIGKPIYIYKHLDKVSWKWLSGNPNVIHLLEEHLDKVDWIGLSENPNAIHILEQHLDKVKYTLSMNPNAIHLLEKHLDYLEVILDEIGDIWTEESLDGFWYLL